MTENSGTSSAPRARGRVLVVDDDAALAEMLGIVLRGEGFDPVFCADGNAAVEAFRASKPDVVLLDLMLPGRDGIDVCRSIRAESGTPIVMLTAKSDTIDVVVGLESGADDYIVKPFKPKELVARIRARIRRTDDVGSQVLTISDLSIDIGEAARPSLYSGGSTPGGVGLPARGRHTIGQRARPAPTGKDRARPRSPRDRAHCAGSRIQGRFLLT